ncbi:ArsR/SmtB family transcription factor [Streptomyces sp. NPDC007088]|uniref:ArsR/SmtB family transcription factor n=1 Tax=Streptomyces sp. NPDC007088 TaxID=3364773 RepID=UPI0036B54908
MVTEGESRGTDGGRGAARPARTVRRPPVAARVDSRSPAPAHGAQSPAPSAAPSFSLAARVFAQLGDPTRLRLLWLLREGEWSVGELSSACGTARPSVSQHLARLRAAGLVRVRKDGRRALYSLPGGACGALVADALRHAERLPLSPPRHTR